MRPATGQMVRCKRLPWWMFLVGDNFEIWRQLPMVRCERLPGRIFLGDNFEATLGQLCGNLETTADGRLVRR